MKDITVFLDGTWNDPEYASNDTNVVRLREIVRKTLIVREKTGPNAGDAAAGQHIVFYERGVGTGPLDRLQGGAFGSGLATNVRRAYKFLSQNYEAGDRVFVFGFSRGAYTARSLVGMIAAAGLLQAPYCSPNLEASAWHYYRTHPHDRDPATRHALSAFTHPPGSFIISCLGVFDTVGALGIPIQYFWRFNRELFQFHDVQTSASTTLNLHALAIDEHRPAFQAALWRRPNALTPGSTTEQTWFTGSHSDIGGGNILADRRHSGSSYLDDVSLDWMIKRLLKTYPDYPAEPLLASGSAFELGRVQITDSRKGAYKIGPVAMRAIGDVVFKPRARMREIIVGVDRHSDVFNEAVHVSALEAIGRSIGKTKYMPYNLSSCLEILGQTYSDVHTDTSGLRIVDWAGTVLDPAHAEQRRIAAELVKSARARL